MEITINRVPWRFIDTKIADEEERGDESSNERTTYHRGKLESTSPRLCTSSSSPENGLGLKDRAAV